MTSTRDPFGKHGLFVLGPGRDHRRRAKRPGGPNTEGLGIPHLGEQFQTGPLEPEVFNHPTEETVYMEGGQQIGKRELDAANEIKRFVRTMLGG